MDVFDPLERAPSGGRRAGEGDAPATRSPVPVAVAVPLDDEERRWVHLLDVPVEPFLGLQAWLAEVFRELQLVEVGATQGVKVSARLRELAAALRIEIARPRDFLVLQLSAARDQGHEVTEVWLDLRASAATDMARFVVLCDEIRWCCADGLLLSAPPSPVFETLLRWLARELIGQLEIGRPPRPCELSSDTIGRATVA